MTPTNEAEHGLPELPEPDYVWSLNNEDFQYDSLDDLLCCNDDIEAGRIVYRGVPKSFTPSNFVPDVGWIAEQMSEQAYDQVGEHADDWPTPSAESSKELEAILKDWANKHCGPCPFYAVNKSEPYTITEDDLK